MPCFNYPYCGNIISATDITCAHCIAHKIGLLEFLTTRCAIPESCSVCLRKDRLVFVVHACRHVICVHCFAKMVEHTESTLTCALCRSDITEDLTLSPEFMCSYAETVRLFISSLTQPKHTRSGAIYSAIPFTGYCVYALSLLLNDLIYGPTTRAFFNA
jgi:hypothetical protein